MHCLFVFTSSCLFEGSCIVCSSLLPVVCRRAHVLFVRLYLQLFVGGLMYCLFVFTSSCLRRTNNTSALLQTTGGKDEQTIHEPSYKQLEVKTNKQYISPPTNNWR
jgi:hypothetical protein